MTMIKMFLKEMDQEAETTLKMLSRIPEDKYNWKPHEKSMSMVTLATHIAELPSWVKMGLETDELNFDEKAYVPKVVKNNKELLGLLETSLSEGKASLEKSKDDILGKEWVMRNGEEIYYKATKADVIRMAYSQIVHHRAQMGVYLRLLNIPIPGSYGPSADEH